jgi:hypothetical protein
MVESPLQVEPHPFLQCGEIVRIRSGPLTGIEGILVRKTRGARVVLSVEMLSKSAAVEVDVTAVEHVRAGEMSRRETTRVASRVSDPPPQPSCVLAGR